MDTQFGWVLSRINLETLLDILLVSLVFFWLLTAIQGTRAVQLVRGIGVLLFAAVILGSVLKLTALSWLIRNSIPAMLVALPVIFQPELRRALETLGRGSDFFSRSNQFAHSPTILASIDEVVATASELSRRHIGALIVMERRTGLQEYANKGTLIDARVSRQLLANLFFPNSPLHDGAVIVRGGRVVAAGVVLPLTENTFGSIKRGTRHRAAIGITEHSDAVVVVVSEETGTISLAVNNGKLISNLDDEQLAGMLRGLFRLRSKRGKRQAADERRLSTLPLDVRDLGKADSPALPPRLADAAAKGQSEASSRARP